MGSIYQFIQLKKIEFQTDCNDVLISCEITQNMEIIQNYFMISHTELNKIFGELQNQNNHLNLYDLLERVPVSNETEIYSLDLEKNNIQNTWIPELFNTANYKQIRA
ncbi:MAG: hypothetical protein V4622_01490 [Bacteroidota bacterium]